MSILIGNKTKSKYNENKYFIFFFVGNDVL